MPTPGDAQIVRKRSHFSIAQLIGKARYRLHTLAMREFTAPMPSSIATIRLRGSARRSVLLPRSATTLFGIPLPILKSVAAGSNASNADGLDELDEGAQWAPR